MRTQHGMMKSCVAEEFDALTSDIIGAAIAVHRALGPGLLESAYEACLAYELSQRGLAVERQKALPVVYRGVTLECGFRIDLLVAGKVVVEVKAVDQLMPVHKAQLISYLRLSSCEVGLLVNFNTNVLRDGIQRVACRSAATVQKTSNAARGQMKRGDAAITTPMPSSFSAGSVSSV